MNFDNIVDLKEFQNEGAGRSMLCYGNCDGPSAKFSIIIPTYQRKESLRKTLSSVCEQTFSDYEIVIMDNNAEDESDDVLNIVKSIPSSKIRYYKNSKNLGAEGNFNRGIQLAKGQYVVLLHDDDFLNCNFLKVVNQHLRGERAIFTHIKMEFKNQSVPLNPERRGIKQVLKSFALFFIHSAYLVNPFKNEVTVTDVFFNRSPTGAIGAVYHRASLLEVGGFNREVYPGSDYDLNMRYICRFGADVIPFYGATYCIGENDSVGASALFPYFNFELRKYMIEKGYVPEGKKFREARVSLFYFDIAATTQLWHVDCKIPEEEIPERSKLTQKLFQMKQFLIMKLKFGSFWKS